MVTLDSGQVFEAVYVVSAKEYKDQSTQVYMTGNAAEFLPLPAGKIMSDMIDVCPHQGREVPNRLEGMDYYWCLFGAGESRMLSYRVNPPF